MVHLDPIVGSEQGKTRPCVIVSSDDNHNSNVRLIIPFTSWQNRFAFHPNKQFVAASDTNNLANDSAADAMQIRAVSIQRFARQVGRLDELELSELSQLIAATVEA